MSSLFDMKGDERAYQIQALTGTIRALNNELESLLAGNLGAPTTTTEEPSLEDMTGCEVIIIKGQHIGKRGILEGPRGSVFWYIRLDDGTDIYKKSGNFRMLPFE